MANLCTRHLTFAAATWSRRAVAKMHTKATLYHNPSCSKSRSAHSLLMAYNAMRPSHEQVAFDVVDYMDKPLDIATLDSILSMLPPDEHSTTPPNPLQIVRTGNAAFGQLALDQLDPADPVHRREILIAIVTHPSLLERPIFVKDGRAVIARPPQRVLEMLP